MRAGSRAAGFPYGRAALGVIRGAVLIALCMILFRMACRVVRYACDIQARGVVFVAMDQAAYGAACCTAAEAFRIAAFSAICASLLIILGTLVV